MSHETIFTENAPKAIGPYSQAILAGDTLYVSGQLPVDPKTSEQVEKCIKAQTRQALENGKAIIEKAGMSFENVVKCTVLLKDIKNFSDMNEVYSEYFTKNKPARVAYQVAELPIGAMVEIDFIAYKKS